MKRLLFFVAVVISAINFSFKSYAGNFYTIKPHDTLWDISKSHYKDPFLWGKIWLNNVYINNPNLIFPGEVIEFTKYGIVIPSYKKVAKKHIKKIVANRFDSSVWLDNGIYYSDCGNSFCSWKQNSFIAGKLIYDTVNHLNVYPKDKVFIKTQKKLPKEVYVYSKLDTYRTLEGTSGIKIFVPIGVVDVGKKIKGGYEAVIAKSIDAINQNNILSFAYPFRQVKRLRCATLGNVKVKVISACEYDLSSKTGNYIFFKILKNINENILGKTVFVDRVNEGALENINVAEGIVVSQYKNYISVFVPSVSDYKEVIDTMQTYVLR